MAIEADIYSENVGFASSVLGIIGDYEEYNNLQEHQKQIAILDHQQQGFQSLGINSDFATMAFSQSVASLLERQRQEFEWLLQFQSERLRNTLQEASTQQLAILLQRYESTVMSLIRQKEEELAIATKKKSMLESYLKKIEVEIQTWQNIAKVSESKVADLNHALTGLRERNHHLSLSSAAPDAGSYCDSSSSSSDRVENGGVLKDECEKMNCKSCKARRSCVVFLPCSHLCLCKFCGDFLGFCPVCQSVKEASVEVIVE